MDHNRHLNLFHFFNDNDKQYIEDNLSRAFAICLKNDPLFLNLILSQVMKEDNVDSLFSNEFSSDEIQIGIQRKANALGEFSKVIGVACSAQGLSMEGIEDVTSRSTQEPIVDVWLTKDDLCVIFEFKRNYADCTSQLKGQADAIVKGFEQETEVLYEDLNWEKIIKSLIRCVALRNQIGKENIFTSEFLGFLQYSYPNWFPVKPFSAIPFPISEEDHNGVLFNARLDKVKIAIIEKLGIERAELKGKYQRLVLSHGWGWANEINIRQDQFENGDFVSIVIHAGDTKGQGWHIYQGDFSIGNLPHEKEGYKIEIKPYFKFSHFNSGIFWFKPENDDSVKSHNTNFFRKWAGRYKTDEERREFEEMMDSKFPYWRDSRDYHNQITMSNRTYFDLSLGIELSLLIPYKEIQLIDSSGDLKSITGFLTEKVQVMIDLLNNLRLG